ncbi:MAG: diguanylate cyclase [Campylobacterota bacterium]|nr:diguanylate cyclase [Campylobacterota bacterium]
MTFRFKLLMTFILYGLSLVLFGQTIFYMMNEKQIKTSSIEKAAEIFEKKNKEFQLNIKNTNLKLQAIQKSKTFKAYLSNPAKIDQVKSLFLDIAHTSDNIMQLRYIDTNGLEVIRIDRDSDTNTVYAVEENNLQDKSSRYYFKKAVKSKTGEFWYSNLDLNIEHGKIVKPIQPVLRIATPVEFEKEMKGILIINIFMKSFLEELIDNVFNNIYLYNDNGYVMVDSVHQHCWNEYLNNNETIYNHFYDDDFKNMLSQERYKSEHIYAGKIFLNNGENIRMVIEPKDEHIKGELTSIVYQLMLILLGVILLSFPLSYFFSNIPTRLKDKVDKQKEEQDTLLSLFDLGEVVLFNWNNDDVWSVNHVSKSVEKFLAYSIDDFKSNRVSYASCIHPDYLQQVMDEVNKAISDKVYFFEHAPYRVITKDKKVKWILDSTVVVRNEDGEIINFIGYLNDITELKDKEILLQKLSITDQLTQIYNRMHLDEMLQTQFYRFNRSKEECSVILVDIDYFKVVNDEYGHLVGDKVLIEFARLLKHTIRSSDSVGRWGGEEFLIVLPHTNLHDALALAHKIRKQIENNIFTIVKHKTASFGVATLKEGMSIEVLTDKADIALYKSKSDGRNRVSTIQLD